MNSKNMTMSIGFITYNPQEIFFVRLKILVKLGYSVYVFDNSPEVRATKIACDKNPNIYYATAGHNAGLGIGLSVINATCFYDENQYLLFFDQDTCFTDKTLNYIRDIVDKLPYEIINQHALIGFNKKSSTICTQGSLQEALLVISSGSLFILKNLKAIGWHNTRYFVDGVDYEICLRARTKGFRVATCGNTPGFDHETEQPDEVVCILGKKLPIRRYPMSRITDAVKSYCHLIIYTASHLNFRATSLIARSFLIYVLGQVWSRIMLKGTH